jgi:hypothetical protein
MNRIVCLFIFLFGVQYSFAQTERHYNAWSRISIAYPLTEKWRLEIDMQHRRQNNYFDENKANLLRNNLLHSVRFWGHYKLNKNFGLSISPFAYFLNVPLIRYEKDVDKPSVKEIRHTIAFDFQPSIASKIHFLSRTTLEYRNFEGSNPDFWRGRQRIGIRYDIAKKWSVNAFEEVFLNLNHLSTNSLLEHNRLGLLLNYKPNQHWRIETGYIHIHRKSQNVENLINIENILLHIYFTLPKLNKNHSSWK